MNKLAGIFKFGTGTPRRFCRKAQRFLNAKVAKDAKVLIAVSS